jgi:DNA (cytosine-5)-methyltransferase 1
MVGCRDEAGAESYSEQTALFASNYECTGNFRIPEPVKLNMGVLDLIDKFKQRECYYFPKDHQYMPELTKTIKSRNTLYQWRRTHVRENKSNVCPTLTANMGAGGHNVPLLVDDWGFRRLTPRECFRFQGFPENYIIPENVVDSQLYKQAGNSVVVPIIKRIALEIKRSLDKCIIKTL